MMTPAEELVMEDALLEGLESAEAFVCERQMRSALLALCHAQQLEIAALKRNYAAAREDLARFTRGQVA